MATGDRRGRAYVVRDAIAPDGGSHEGEGKAERGGDGEVARVYPYTLQGLTAALDEARFRSFGGKPQVLAVVTEGRSTVIRRYEDGHEVPIT